MHTPSGGDPRWRKAAVLGSLWAASEILLGSFLHNLQVPLRGHLLTAVAVVILAAGQRQWPERGLVWRAGLVAAAMKAVSPSAVLLGPMLAIAMEGAAFEAGVAAAGRRAAGCMLGGALAMSWTFVHQLASLLVTYGPNLVEVYRRLVRLAGAAAGGLSLGPWSPLLALLALNLMLGAGAAVLGWRAARRRSQPVDEEVFLPLAMPVRRQGGGPPPSLAVLLALALLLPAGLLVLPRLSLPVAAGGVCLVLAAVASRYRAAMRRFARPHFWLGLLLVTAAAAVAFRVGAQGAAGLRDGLRVAGAMTLRAAFVTACFAAIGVELSNRRLRRLLSRLGAAPLQAAVEVAFATLPAVVSVMPPARQLLRHPGRSAAAIMPRLDRWLAQVEAGGGGTPAIVITGSSGSGKTTLAAEAAEELSRRAVVVGGIVAPGCWREGHRWSFDVVDLATRRGVALCAREGPDDWLPEVGFRVSPTGLDYGRRVLQEAAASPADVVVVDEVGPWELRGRGWAPALDALSHAGKPLVLVVRPDCIEAVAFRWGLRAESVFEAGRVAAGEVAAATESLIAAQRQLVCRRA